MKEQQSFPQQVYALVSQIPEGKVMTYGQIALVLRSPRASRIVGGAMSRAPEGIPCHRVLNRLGELSPPQVFGPGVQRERLLREGVIFLKNGRVDLSRCVWDGA
ncbi:MAG TPA: methylated-DNA--[protein]-cysteine S-methyltransferase [Clostridia bacterium]|nr:methylated-DNA--[protein]-cysteine S-methyltransferase [Clostridia bacterium]